MKLSLSQKQDLTEALKKASVSKCWICIDKILEIVTTVLEKKKFGHIHIDDINCGMTSIEDNRVFNTILRLFIRNKKRDDLWFNLEEKDIYSNNLMFRQFEEFCLKQWFKWFFSVNMDNPLLMARIEALFIDFKKRYWYHVKNSTRYYDEIIKKLWLSKHAMETRQTMLNFNTAYSLVKNLFKWLKRKAIDENWHSERSFEHLKWTMEIVLRELPNPNISKIILALLHDIAEDIKWINLESIKQMFPWIWENLVKWINELTKINRRTFLSDSEKIEVEILEKWKTKEECKKMLWDNLRYTLLVEKWKNKRDKIYFWNLSNLLKVNGKTLEEAKADKDILYVKFADRIHNLRTLKNTPKFEIARKIIQTEKYFLNVAFEEFESTNWKCNAYYLMLKEINKLKEDKEVLKIYDEEHWDRINE